MTSEKRILVVGAGAVGQVMAFFLRSGGAEVAFLVKEKNRAAAQGPLRLYRIRGKKRVVPLSLAGVEVLASIDEVKTRSFDAVVLTVASTALDDAFLTSLGAGVGPAPIVSLQPGLKDEDRIASHIARASRSSSASRRAFARS
jgi:2-dehydropantoate 2-reductase